MTSFFCVGFLFIYQCEIPASTQTPADSYSVECRTYTISKKDTTETQRNIARENARCRAAKGRKK